MVKTVSVIVPCYKYAHFLPDCIGSLVKQTYPISEIIIVNDNSPDNTSEVAKGLIDKYPGKGIILAECEENGGLSSARNVGIEIATSELIMCLDADDKLTPGAIEEHVKLIEDEKCIAQNALMNFGESHETYTPQGATLDSLLTRNTVYCNAMFPRKAWEEVGGYDESETMRFGLEDWLFWIGCAKKGYKFRTSDFIALRYRQHANNMTNATTHPNWQKITNYMRTVHPDLQAK